MGNPGHIKPDLPKSKTQTKPKGAGARRWGEGRRRKRRRRKGSYGRGYVEYKTNI